MMGAALKEGLELTEMTTRFFYIDTAAPRTCTSYLRLLLRAPAAVNVPCRP